MVTEQIRGSGDPGEIGIRPGICKTFIVRRTYRLDEMISSSEYSTYVRGASRETRAGSETVETSVGTAIDSRSGANER